MYHIYYVLLRTQQYNANSSLAYNCFGPKPTSLFSSSGNGNSTWIQLTNTYVANKTNPILIFGFNVNGSMYTRLDDVSVVDTTNPSVQLLANPGFESSPFNATGWTNWCASVCNNGTAGYLVSSGCRNSTCYMNKCTGGTEYIGQGFPAIIGRTYNISFWFERVKYAASVSWMVLHVGII